MDFDLLVQGPLNGISLKCMLRAHPQFNDIILSHWDTDSLSASLPEDLYVKAQDAASHICVTPLPDLATDAYQPLYGRNSDCTFFYSIISTYNGLKKCTSPYVVKMRSDESYTNFSPLKQKFLQDTRKMVCGNIFFKRWKDSPLHIGDHLFLASRESLLKAYETLIEAYSPSNHTEEVAFSSIRPEEEYNLEKKFEWCRLAPHLSGQETYTPESILANAYLNSCDVYPPVTDPATFMKYFDVVDINELSPYTARWGHGGRTYDSELSPFGSYSSIKVITTIEQLLS